MSDQRRYVPILKAREAECWALKVLQDSSKPRITPLFEAVPPSERMPIPVRIKDTAEKIYVAWQDRAFYADMKWISEFSDFFPDNHVVGVFFDWAERLGMNPIPVTALDRDEAYQRATAKVAAKEARLAIRLAGDDFDDSTKLSRAIDALLGLCGLRPEQGDVIIDYGDVQAWPVNVLSTAIRSHVEDLPHLERWRGVTIAGGCSPGSLVPLVRGEWSMLPRNEWMAWRSATISGKLARSTSYGDYTVNSAEIATDAGIPKSASLRYSADSDYLIWRGEVRDADFQADMFTVCSSLVKMPEFSGESFSRGDAEIQARATNRDSPGVPKDWRAWATNHYLELVASQLASLPEP
jgi:hypothetical protein